MKVRSDILTSRKALLLSGVILTAMLPAAAAQAQNAGGSNWYSKAAAQETGGWYSNGYIEAGSNYFIQKPPSGFGKSPTDPFWLTPLTTDSRQKMDEYGKIPRSLFLSDVGINAGSRDGRVALDFWADNVATNFQSYYLSIYEPGRQYFDIGWEQTPHLLSSSAKDIFMGVGTSRLTVDPASRGILQANLGGASQTQAQRNNIDNYINNSAPIANIDLQTMREKLTTSYRNTMLEGWDFNADYSNERRSGTRPLGMGWGYAFQAGAGVPAAPRPSSGSIEVPQVLDDRTQNANSSAEFAGTTPWGARWNTSLAYSGSFYNNNVKSMDVDNPFCITCRAANGVAVPAGSQIGPNMLRYGLYADNAVNGVTWNTAVNLPFWRTRYTSNVQYNMFRQNDPFINDATNGITTMAPYPATSLNGAVNAFLTNNMLESHPTSELTNIARLRYYDRQDNTPTLAFTNYVFADNGTATTTPLTRDPHSYTKLNASDDLKWQPNRTWGFGAGYFFERYTFANGEVDATNESGAKAFVNLTPWSYVTSRSSVQFSERRYDNWLGTSTDPAAAAMRQFFVANRDRTKAETTLELVPFKNITVSPNAGMRYDEYPSDIVPNANNLPTTSVGTKHDRSWNAGTDLNVRLNSTLGVMFGYNHEEHYLRLETCCGGGAATNPFLDSQKWSSDITQRYNTYTVSADWKAIPGKLDFKADFLVALSNEANLTTFCSNPLPAGAANCNGVGSAAPLGTQFPDERNRFQRLNLIAKYYFDRDVVRRMGLIDLAAKVRYTWQYNHNSNWATDNFSPYSPSPVDGGVDTTNGGRSLFLAYNNPNYNAQIVALSLAARW
jgi:MtrB/PioB family decaheme-associated outer membrane protein